VIRSLRAPSRNQHLWGGFFLWLVRFVVCLGWFWCRGGHTRIFPRRCLTNVQDIPPMGFSPLGLGLSLSLFCYVQRTSSPRQPVVDFFSTSPRDMFLNFRLPPSLLSNLRLVYLLGGGTRCSTSQATFTSSPPLLPGILQSVSVDFFGDAKASRVIRRHLSYAVVRLEGSPEMETFMLSIPSISPSRFFF